MVLYDELFKIYCKLNVQSDNTKFMITKFTSKLLVLDDMKICETKQYIVIRVDKKEQKQREVIKKEKLFVKDFTISFNAIQISKQMNIISWEVVPMELINWNLNKIFTNTYCRVHLLKWVFSTYLLKKILQKLCYGLNKRALTDPKRNTDIYKEAN